MLLGFQLPTTRTEFRFFKWSWVPYTVTRLSIYLSGQGYIAVPVPWSVLTGAYTDSVTVGTDGAGQPLESSVTPAMDRQGAADAPNETVAFGGFSTGFGNNVIGWVLERNGGLWETDRAVPRGEGSYWVRSTRR